MQELQKNLHSTMFLLIPDHAPHAIEEKENLHSTMFLLIRDFLAGFHDSKAIYIPQCFY